MTLLASAAGFLSRLGTLAQLLTTGVPPRIVEDLPKQGAPEPVPAAGIPTPEPLPATAVAAPAPKKIGRSLYRNPENSKETWSGRGRRPKWFVSAMAAGADPSTLLAPEPEPIRTARKTAGAARRVASARKVPVAASGYRHPTDPKLTWTGNGRPPQWFKQALSEGFDKTQLRIA
ncbi:H-NS histone family protein [Cereibacter sphaeroides]|uniref:H-NS histone family protein n=1 Tax=Cereibacter sphaeroides TaxID=1063 RepID=UPI001F25BC61|nr:H-NS histone family protein [Cereibacter sphaeroides]MCE6957634.1 H-NS histone family protein [Cereibacter sphaeroides]MCE6971230.1 H-NS histone family protein [Cereibacter sphaeroides]